MTALARGTAIAILQDMRRAVAIVLTTLLCGAVAHAGHGSGKRKKEKPARKSGVKFVIDRVNKDQQVVEREVVTGPIGRTRGRSQGKARARSREVTLDAQARAMAKNVAVEEIDAALPDSLTLEGRLEEVESVNSVHNGSEVTRTKLRRKGAEHRGTAVETRIYARGKVRTIRPMKGAVAEEQMLGRGEPVSLVGSISVPSGEAWAEMSGISLSYRAHQPTTITLLSGVAIPLSRDLVAEAMRKGKAGSRDMRLENDGEHLTITLLNGVGGGGAYRMPTAHMAGFLRDTYRSVPRADEARRVGDLDAELENLVNEGE